MQQNNFDILKKTFYNLQKNINWFGKQWHIELQADIFFCFVNFSYF